MNDYIIQVDDNGQPYISHALKNYKYIAKEKVGDRFRYFYTQKEWDAFKKAKYGVKEATRTIADKAKELDDKTRELLAGPGGGVNKYVDDARRGYERAEEVAKLYPYDDGYKLVRDNKKAHYEEALKYYPSVSEKVKGWFNDVLSKKIDDIFRKDAPAATLTPSGTGTIIKEKNIPETRLKEKDLSKEKMNKRR